MAVTLKDVAERAGVSRSAVSRSFTPGASVSARTRQKVHEAAEALGYSPNALASSLTTGRTKLIGLVADNFRNPIFLEVFDRFTKALQDRGLRPLLVNLSDETDPAGSVRMLRQYSVDGVIVASSTLPPSFAAAFNEAGLNVVHAFGRNTQAPPVPVVSIDNVACGRMAAATLVARGYTHIGFLGGPESASSTQDRLTGFRAELSRHPQLRFTHSFARRYGFNAGREEMARLLQGDRAEAYFCGDDVLSFGALSAIRDHGLVVPRDIGVIGLNDMAMSGWESFNLTTIHQPLDQIIDGSVALIAELVEGTGPEAPVTQIFDCHVVERGTLRPLA